jgi:nucleotide-binding universal stress UspA family protein
VTVVVGYVIGKSGTAPLRLAAETARALHSPLTVASVVPRAWPTPSPARVDAEFAAYAKKLGEESQAEAQNFLSNYAPGVQVQHLTVPSRTVGDGLLEAVAEVDAEVLVVGSSSDGALGQVVLGSSTDWLLHASPVPVALTPRGYRGVQSGSPTRITWGYSGSDDSGAIAERVVALANRLNAKLRVISFAIRGRTMFPPEVGLHAEDSLLAQWASQLRDSLAQLKANNVVSADTEVEVVMGNGWDQALDAVNWVNGDLLILGTTSRHNIKGVFLGSHSAKIIRHSPVPVLVLPH